MDIDGRYLYELDDVDDTTATLLLELHLSDVEELLSTGKGKGNKSEHSDADLAVLTYQNELKERDTIIADRRMARSLTRAVLSDAAIVTELLTQEDVVTRDRQNDRSQ